MSYPDVRRSSPLPAGPQPTGLADLLERVLDKGLVIAGDIRVNLLDIELLTIKLRLVIASMDTAREAGIDWWTPRSVAESLRVRADAGEPETAGTPGGGRGTRTVGHRIQGARP